MTTHKKSLSIALAAFAFLCITLSSCDRKTCPTYSKTTEHNTVNKA